MDVLALAMAKADAARKLAPIGQVAPGVKIYNPRGLRRWSAALSDSLYARPVITVIGDSMVDGLGSDNTVSTNDSTACNQAWPGQMRQLFTQQFGVDPGEGWIGAADDRVVRVGGTQYYYIAPFGDAWSLASGNSLTFTLPVCDAIDIIMFYNGASTKPVVYNLDGAGDVTAADGGPTADTFYKVSLTGLALTAHTLVLKGPATGSTFPCGVIVKKGTAGVRVNRVGKGGNTLKDFHNPNNTLSTGTLQTRYFSQALDQIGGDLFILEFAHNDWQLQITNGTTLADYTTRLQDLIQKITVDRSACLLLLGPPTPPNAEPAGALNTYSDYWDVMKALALANDHVAHMRISDLWGTTYATGNARGLYLGNSVHPTRKGYGSWARLVFRALSMPLGEYAPTT